jgi:nucleotide-binding universal stress UspA family protein
MVVEAARPQDYALRFPLREGDRAWIGVRRIHALTHPGMSFLVVTNGSSESRGALRAGGRIARLAHARVTVLGQGVDAESLRPEMQELRSLVGSELIQEPRLAADPHPEAVLRDVSRFSYDLIVHRLPSRGGARFAERLLASGEHHLLLVRDLELTPTRALLCVTVSEPAKEDVQFAGRLFRHLGAEATLLTVISDRGAQELHDRAERFLSASERTLARSGVRSRGVVRAGSMPEQVLAELRERPSDLLVLGVPLSTEGAISLSKPVSELLEETKIPAVLLVRSRSM